MVQNLFFVHNHKVTNVCKWQEKEARYFLWILVEEFLCQTQRVFMIFYMGSLHNSHEAEKVFEVMKM